MTGGEIFIDGDAGNELGHTLRRGLIAIRGNCGDGIGFNMLAGTILVFGAAGIRPGAGMRRGTIGFLGSAPAPPMLPTFKFTCQDRPDFLRVYLVYLRRHGFFVPDECLSAICRRFHGDFLELGKGEILVRSAV
jgi:formylmethanofuran dehydrogenase subunit C